MLSWWLTMRVSPSPRCRTLRKQMKQAGASVRVAKNRLAKIALQGTEVASIAPLLTGPTVIAFSGDPIAAPKVATDFAKAHDKFVILGGAMGKTALDANGVKALATLPSLDELRAKIIGLIQAPATKIARRGQRAGGEARPRGPGLRQEGRSGVTQPNLDWFERIGRKYHG